jgi:hypothetical protein
MRYLFFLSFFLIGSCVTNQSNVDESKADSLSLFYDLVGGKEKPLFGADTLKEDFKDFHDRFIQDSLFQVSRLKFPLGGKRILDDESYDWNLDNWTMIKVSLYEIDTTEYKHKLEIQEDPEYKSFRLFIPNSGFEFSARFQLIEHKWHLVFCVDMI